MVHREDERSRGNTSKGSDSFRGNFDHLLDNKGRVSLPSEFRSLLVEVGDEKVVLTNYISQGARCIEGFLMSKWIEFEDKLRCKSRFNPKIQMLENYYLSRASDVRVDKQGRILVPQYLRDYAGIEREVTFTSSIHGFRLWNTKVWKVVFAEAEAKLMEEPESFENLDL